MNIASRARNSDLDFHDIFSRVRTEHVEDVAKKGDVVTAKFLRVYASKIGN